MKKYIDLTRLGRLVQIIKNLLAGKANDADVVKTTGNQDVNGTKTFRGQIVIINPSGNNNEGIKMGDSAHPAYISFYNGNNRCGYAGRDSNNSNDVTLSAERGILNLTGQKLRLQGDISNPLEFRLGDFAQNSYSIRFNADSLPDNRTIALLQLHKGGKKAALFLNKDARGNISWGFTGIPLSIERIPSPTNAENPANKAYVDALKAAVKTAAANASDFAAFKAAIANL